MVYKIAWGLALVFGGILVAGYAVPAIALLTGIALVVAGVAFIAGI